MLQEIPDWTISPILLSIFQAKSHQNLINSAAIADLSSSSRNLLQQQRERYAKALMSYVLSRRGTSEVGMIHWAVVKYGKIRVKFRLFISNAFSPVIAARVFRMQRRIRHSDSMNGYRNEKQQQHKQRRTNKVAADARHNTLLQGPSAYASILAHVDWLTRLVKRNKASQEQYCLFSIGHFRIYPLSLISKGALSLTQSSRLFSTFFVEETLLQNWPNSLEIMWIPSQDLHSLFHFFHLTDADNSVAHIFLDWRR